MRWVRLLACLGVLGPGSLAYAQPTQGRADNIAILPIVVGSTPGQTSISEIFDRAVDATNMRLGLRALSFEQISLDVGTRVRECGSDSGCIASALRAFDARLALVVVANFSLEPPVVQIQLLDTDERKLIDSDIAEVGAGETVPDIVLARVQGVLEGGGYKKAGRLVAEVLPGNARIALDKTIEPDVGTPNVFTLLPGRYELFAESEGFISHGIVVEIAPGAETRVRLELEREPTVLESPWLWGAVGTAVVGGTVAALLLTRSTERCLCTQVCQGGVCFGCENCP